MTNWERNCARKVADSAISQAIRHFYTSKQPLNENQVLLATASSAMLAQQHGNLSNWLSVCIAIAERLSDSFVAAQNCIAKAKSSSKHTAEVL